MRDTLSFFWEVLKIFILALIIVLPIRFFLLQAFVVKGASMEPSFQNGDYLIVNEISYRFDSPQRGDVIVFHYPFNPRLRFIKRVIALPGDTVEITNGKVKIYDDKHPDGEILKEPYLPPNTFTSPSVSVLGKVEGELIETMGPNEYFVMGDNRRLSFDSRSWGPLDRKYIIGKVEIRLFSFDKFPHLSLLFR